MREMGERPSMLLDQLGHLMPPCCGSSPDDAQDAFPCLRRAVRGQQEAPLRQGESCGE
jgi:hypothetical protein